MKNEGLSYEFTTKELFYYLFVKKKCPVCSGIMDKSKGYEIVEGAKLNSKADPIFGTNTKVKNYHYYYSCQKCGKRYTLKELAK